MLCSPGFPLLNSPSNGNNNFRFSISLRFSQTPHATWYIVSIGAYEKFMMVGPAYEKSSSIKVISAIFYGRLNVFTLIGVGLSI